MKRLAIAAALGAVIAADAAMLIGVAVNRSGQPEARLVLTERELTRPEQSEDNSAIFLRLEWRLDRSVERGAWLAGLAPGATARQAFAVLELRPDADAGQSRLFLIDAGPDRASLRERYQDPARYAITAATVRVLSRDPAGYFTVMPDMIYVPRAYNKLFQGRVSSYEVALCYGRLGDPWVCGANRK